jgi:hypothetical protein
LVFFTIAGMTLAPRVAHKDRRFSEALEPAFEGIRSRVVAARGMESGNPKLSQNPNLNL